MAAVITVFVIILLITLVFAVANYLYNIAIKPGGYRKLAKNPENSEASPGDPFYDDAAECWRSAGAETLKITSCDGYVLQGYFIKSEKNTERIAMLLHGYSGNASEMAVYARFYHNEGFDVFAPDNRGHGGSEGRAVGMGWLDRLDCLRWIELLTEKFGNAGMIVHGHSMGGAAACALSGEELPPSVKGIISDCAFDSVKNILTWQVKNIFKLPAFPFVPAASLICRLRAGYFFGEGDIAAKVSKCKIPILFIHGEDDLFVPFSMSDTLFEAAEPSLREIWTVKGAGHIGSVKAGGEGYMLRVKKFINRVFD